MKLALSILGAAAFLTACGTQDNQSEVKSAASRAPNLYACSTEDGMVLHYSTSSILGKPQLSISQVVGGDASLTLVSAIGDQIDVALNQGGVKVVSVRKAIPDLKTTEWSLVIPRVTLDADQDATFESTLKEVVTPTSIMGPLPGMESKTTLHKMQCEASFGVF